MLAGIKSLLRKPKWRTLLFVSFVMLFYFTRTRAADPIGDLQFDGVYGYMAVGRGGIEVLDFSNPMYPVKISEFDTLGYVHSIQIQGDQIFVANDSAGLEIISKKDLLSDGKLEDIILGNYKTPGRAVDVAVKGNYAYIVDSGGDVWILNIKKQLKEPNKSNGVIQEFSEKVKQITIAGDQAYFTTNKNELLIYTIDKPEILNKIGSYNVGVEIHNFEIVGNRAYLAADSEGLVVLNIGDPSDIQLLKKIGNVKDALDVRLQGNYAYIASGGEGFFILDISEISEITQVGHETSPANAHLIRVREDYVYVGDDRDGLRIFHSPIEFEFSKLTETNSLGTFGSVGVKDDYAYAAAGGDGLRVINVEDLTAPVGIYFDDKVDDFASALDIKEDILYVLYRNKGLRLFSINETAVEPLSGSEVDTPGEANDLIVRGNLVYIADGSEGMQIVDLEDHKNPKVYSEDTKGDALGVYVFGDYGYIADGEAGLRIMLVSDPEKPTLINTVDTPGTAKAVFVSNIKQPGGNERTYAFIADGDHGLLILDVTDANQPNNIATFAVEKSANDVVVRDTTVYLAEGEDGLMLLNISSINAPKLIKNLSTPGDALGIFIQDKLGYMADGKRGLRIIDFKKNEEIQEIGFFDLPKRVEATAIDNKFGYLVYGEDGMWVMDLNNLKSPYPSAFYSTPGNSKAVKVEDKHVYIADGSSGLQVVDVTNPYFPLSGGSYKEIKNAISVAVEGIYVYVGSADQKLHILDSTNLADIEEITAYDIKAEPKDINVFLGYVYIAQGDNGLEVLNAKDPEDPDSILVDHSVVLTDTQSLVVLESRQLLFVADGKNGMKVFDIDRPATPEEIYHFELRSDNGIARSVTIEGEYAFLAVENEAIYQFHIQDINNIREVASTELGKTQSISAISSPTEDDKTKRFFNYLAVGNKGFHTYKVIGVAKIEFIMLYETSGEATMAQVGRAVLSSVISQLSGAPEPMPDKVWERIFYMYYGVLVFFLLTTIWLILVAQFVLPIQTFKDGRNAAWRLFDSLWGKHGPAVFAKEGNLIAKTGELEKQGRGVVRVDLNSAVVLERRRLVHPKTKKSNQKKKAIKRAFVPSQARVEGPGVVFVESKETIRGVADLRPQFRLRPDVQAYTRDGIEVSNPVWVLFTLGQPPEILDVTYDGDRRAENLRVFSKKDVEITTGDGQKQRGLSIGLLADELGQEDKDEIHQYIQNQVLKVYFKRVRTLSLQLNSNVEPLEILELFVWRIRRLAERFEISERKEIQDFLRYVDYLSELTKKEIPFDHAAVQMFGYRLAVLADQLILDGMEVFHLYVQREKIGEYKQKLNAMNSQTALVDYAQRELARFEDVNLEQSDADEFCRNAFRTLSSIETEIENEIRKQKSSGVRRQQNEDLISFQETLRSITGELVRIDYPLSQFFSGVAKLCACISLIILESSQINIREGRRFLNIGQLPKIRKKIRKLQNKIEDLDKGCKPNLERYVDLLMIYDYVEFVRRSIDGLRMTKLADEAQEFLIKSVNQIKRRVKDLESLVSSDFRRFVRMIQTRTAVLEVDTIEASILYFYTQQLDKILKELESEEKKAVRSTLLNISSQIDEIRDDIVEIQTLIESVEINREIEEYLKQILAIESHLVGCAVPPRQVEDEKSGSQRRVGPYLFDRKRILAAIYSNALDKDRVEGEEKRMHWTKLPVHVAAQIFRDMISREQFDYLYQPNDAIKYNLPKLKGNVSRAVRNQGVLGYRFVDHVDGEKLEPGKELNLDSLEFYEQRELTNPKVLRARGIKVIASGFPDLFPIQTSVLSHQLDYWRAPWQRDSIDIRSQHQLRAVRVINHERAQAQRKMANNLAQIMRSSQSEEALAIRVLQALEAAASDKDVRQFITRDTVNLLRSYREWFKSDEISPFGEENAQ